MAMLYSILKKHTLLSQIRTALWKKIANKIGRGYSIKTSETTGNDHCINNRRVVSLTDIWYTYQNFVVAKLLLF